MRSLTAHGWDGDRQTQADSLFVIPKPIFFVIPQRSGGICFYRLPLPSQTCHLVKKNRATRYIQTRYTDKLVSPTCYN